MNDINHLERRHPPNRLSRVKHGIDDVQRGQFELALEHACIAIDVTSKRLYSADKSSKSLYKNLLDEYAWMIELMSLGGVNVNDSIFGNYSIPGYQNPKFKDLVYHIVRCNLVHDEGLPSNFMFAEGDHMVLAERMIVLPKKLIWGLVGIVVFCRANIGERTEDTYWLSIYDNRFVINDFWGQEETAKRIYTNRNLPRVAINWPSENETQQANAADA